MRKPTRRPDERAYANLAPLTNPLGDVRAVADVFRRLSFAELIEGVTRTGLKAVLKDCGDKAVIYHAGHGIDLNGVVMDAEFASAQIRASGIPADGRHLG